LIDVPCFRCVIECRLCFRWSPSCSLTKVTCHCRQHQGMIPYLSLLLTTKDSGNTGKTGSVASAFNFVLLKLFAVAFRLVTINRRRKTSLQCRHLANWMKHTLVLVLASMIMKFIYSRVFISPVHPRRSGFDSGSFAPLCENVTPPTQQEMRNVLQYRQTRTTATGNMYRKFGEIWTCGLQDMRANRQTNRQATYKHADHNTLYPYLGEVITHVLAVKILIVDNIKLQLCYIRCQITFTRGTRCPTT